MTRISPLFLVLLSLGVFLCNLLTMAVHNRATGTLVVDESDHRLLSDPIIEMPEKERKPKKCQVAFPACSHLAALMHGRGIHEYMIVSGLGKDGKDIDDVLLKLYLMHSHCLQNPLVFYDAFGNPEVLPQIRDQYQVEFPTLSTESDYPWLTIPN